MESWASKALGFTARIAGILTLLEDPKATCVAYRAYENARRIMEEYFSPHMQYAFCGERQMTPVAEIVLKAMKASVSREDRFVLESQLWDKLRKRKPFNTEGGKMQFEKALNELGMMGMIRKLPIEPAETGRPIKGAWEVHPELLQNVQAVQPKRLGTELLKFFPQYDLK